VKRVPNVLPDIIIGAERGKPHFNSGTPLPDRYPSKTGKFDALAAQFSCESIGTIPAPHPWALKNRQATCVCELAVVKSYGSDVPELMAKPVLEYAGAAKSAKRG
jgi:hypothetical protein